MLKIELKKGFFMAWLAKPKSNENDNHTVLLGDSFMQKPDIIMYDTYIFFYYSCPGEYNKK